MNTAVATAEQVKPAKVSLLASMAAKYSMEPNAFADAVRKTAMPGNATNEEFAAFLMVAKEYKLNPLLREIHAFPKKGGGIVPVVSIDGWVSLINQHPATNGFEFEMHYNEKNQLVACTCRMYRKDRTHPVAVTEYLVECIRNTEPWKMQHRMLRHKALIQAARYAFGFTGIHDDDEAERIAEMRDITPGTAPAAARPQLSDFTKMPTAEPIAAVEAATQTETVAEDQPTSEPEPLPEIGPPEAMERGRTDRRANKALRAVPPEWREPNMQALADAWTEGWKAEDDEINAAAKEGKKAQK